MDIEPCYMFQSVSRHCAKLGLPAAEYGFLFTLQEGQCCGYICKDTELFIECLIIPLSDNREFAF